jgi:hypothetical protein
LFNIFGWSLLSNVLDNHTNNRCGDRGRPGGNRQGLTREALIMLLINAGASLDLRYLQYLNYPKPDLWQSRLIRYLVLAGIVPSQALTHRMTRFGHKFVPTIEWTRLTNEAYEARGCTITFKQLSSAIEGTPFGGSSSNSSKCSSTTNDGSIPSVLLLIIHQYYYQPISFAVDESPVDNMPSLLEIAHAAAIRSIDKDDMFASRSHRILATDLPTAASTLPPLLVASPLDPPSPSRLMMNSASLIPSSSSSSVAVAVASSSSSSVPSSVPIKSCACDRSHLVADPSLISSWPSCEQCAIIIQFDDDGIISGLYNMIPYGKHQNNGQPFVHGIQLGSGQLNEYRSDGNGSPDEMKWQHQHQSSWTSLSIPPIMWPCVDNNTNNNYDYNNHMINNVNIHTYTYGSDMKNDYIYDDDDWAGARAVTPWQLADTLQPLIESIYRRIGTHHGFGIHPLILILPDGVPLMHIRAITTMIMERLVSPELMIIHPLHLYRIVPPHGLEESSSDLHDLQMTVIFTGRRIIAGVRAGFKCQFDVTCQWYVHELMTDTPPPPPPHHHHHNHDAHQHDTKGIQEPFASTYHQPSDASSEFSSSSSSSSLSSSTSELKRESCSGGDGGNNNNNHRVFDFDLLLESVNNRIRLVKRLSSMIMDRSRFRNILLVCRTHDVPLKLPDLLRRTWKNHVITPRITVPSTITITPSSSSSSSGASVGGGGGGGGPFVPVFVIGSNPLPRLSWWSHMAYMGKCDELGRCILTRDRYIAHGPAAITPCTRLPEKFTDTNSCVIL